MSQVPNSFDYPSHDDRKHLVDVAVAAPGGEWLLPVAEATVSLVNARLASASQPDAADNVARSVRFVQQAYADLQELCWNRHVADSSALALFRQHREPGEPWSDFMRGRIVELTRASGGDAAGGGARELVRICLVLIFFQSCRHRHDADGVAHSLDLFETFLGPGRGTGDYPVYVVMEFYAACMKFELRLLGEGNDAPCPTVRRARQVVGLNREWEPPTQPEETVMAAVALVAGVGRAMVGDRDAVGVAELHLADLDELVEYGLELVDAGRERGIRYFTAQCASPLHAWRGDMERALAAAAEAVHRSSAHPLAFWHPEVMKLGNVIAEVNRAATERRLKDHLAEVSKSLDVHLETTRADLDTHVQSLRDEVNSRVDESKAAIRAEAHQASESASRRAIVPVIEVLGVFVAVLAVAASTVGAAIASGIEWWQRMVIIGAGSVSALVVLGMIRLLVRPSRRDGPRRSAQP